MGGHLTNIKTSVSDAIDTEEWMTEGCSYAAKHIIEDVHPRLRRTLHQWQANRTAYECAEQYTILVYETAQTLMKKCKASEVAVFVHSVLCRVRIRHRPDFGTRWCSPTNICLRSSRLAKCIRGSDIQNIRMPCFARSRRL